MEHLQPWGGSSYCYYYHFGITNEEHTVRGRSTHGVLIESIRKVVRMTLLVTKGLLLFIRKQKDYSFDSESLNSKYRFQVVGPSPPRPKLRYTRSILVNRKKSKNKILLKFKYLFNVSTSSLKSIWEVGKGDYKSRVDRYHTNSFKFLIVPCDNNWFDVCNNPKRVRKVSAGKRQSPGLGRRA